METIKYSLIVMAQCKDYQYHVMIGTNNNGFVNYWLDKKLVDKKRITDLFHIDKNNHFILEYGRYKSFDKVLSDSEIHSEFEKCFDIMRNQQKLISDKVEMKLGF